MSAPTRPDRSLPARTRAAVAVGAAVGGLSRRLGRGSGSVIGGRVLLALEPAALARLSAGRRSALVSGTNGKTTTTCLLREAVATIGPVVTNVQGANLPAGVAAAVAAGEPGSTAVLEVDEAWLGEVVDATDPTVVVLLNLSRDQLDRNSEVRTLAGSWRRTFAGRPEVTVVANADDPLVVWGAGSATRVVWVGAGQPWRADASGCPACGGRIVFPAAGVDHGAEREGPGWACAGCGFRRPPLDVRIEADRVVAADGTPTTLHLALPGRANRADAAMALTAARLLGADADAAAKAMGATAEVAGRYRTVDVDGARVRLLLAKNPAGWVEVLDVLRPPPSPVVVVINARIADGRDPSWLWDVPFERLAPRVVFATGERGRDLAVRLDYADVEHRWDPDPLGAVHAAARVALAEWDGAVDVVANYTSFQALRARLP
ncbi:MAG: MurT ligase domain-containing protein [Acidimicrobiales bacterium]